MAAATHRVPLPGPGRRSGVLEHIVGGGTIGRGTRPVRHGVEAPHQFSIGRVIGTDEATRTEVRAAVADEHLAMRHAWRSGDQVGGIARRGLRAPHFLAAAGVQGDQPAIHRAEIHPALVERDAAVIDIAARRNAADAGHPGVVVPQLLASPGVERIDLAPRGGDIHHAIDHQRRRLLAASGIEFDEPRGLELRNVVSVDLRQCRKALFVPAAVVDQPVLRLRPRRCQARIVDVRKSRIMAG